MNRKYLFNTFSKVALKNTNKEKQENRNQHSNHDINNSTE